MSETGSLRQPPRGLMRWFMRAPIALYRLGLGGLLGGRFLLLEHVGRKSGITRRVVVEVVRHDRESDSYVIASGFGEKSDWLRNLRKTPDAVIQVGRRRLPVRAERLSPAAGGEEMLRYARSHPRAARALGSYMGLNVDGSDESYRAAGEAVPFVILRPR